MPLTAMPKRLQPRTNHLSPERLERAKVPRHRVIVKVALHHRPQPRSGLGNPLMPPPAQLLPYRLQFAPQPLLDRLPSHREPVTLLGSSTHVCKTQKIEGLGIPLTSALPVLLR